MNEEHRFFGKIIPLEHPRFIMQYNSKRKDEFIKKYLNALCDHAERWLNGLNVDLFEVFMELETRKLSKKAGY